MSKPILNTLLHGADYNHEQWLDHPEVLDQDFKLMEEAKCNVMTIGMFSWAKLEPTEGNFDFTWMDSLMDRLHARGMKAILGTPTASKPAWLSQAYPEVCRVDEQGKREPHGYRHNHCRSSPVFREKARIINGLLAERYKEHPALLMWHVNNEYNSGRCYCNHCISAFRSWLKARYKSLEALNRAWWTSFWSHSYSNWDQIWPADTSIHGLMLDWLRFTSDQSLDFYLAESEPLRRLSPQIPITTNFMRPDVGLDYWDFARHVDIISWDAYPQWHVREPEWKEALNFAFYHDLMRSFKDQPFMLMESSPNVTNWQGVSVPKREHMHLLASMQALAHGSDTVQYFQWRQSRGGEEKFHGAVLSHHARTDTRVFQNVAGVGQALKDLEGLAGAATEAELAIIYDFQSEWAINIAQLPGNAYKDYQNRCIAHYRAFWQAGIPVDIKDSSCEDFSRYKLIVAPMLYMLRPGMSARLEDFVRKGGTLVTGYLTGWVDENDLVFPGGAPGPLKDLLGLWIEDTDTVVGHHKQSFSYRGLSGEAGESSRGADFEVFHFADLLRLETAQSLASFSQGFLEGSPAISLNRYGKGRAYYLASRNEDSFYDRFYADLAADLGIAADIPQGLPAGVTGRSRSTDKARYHFYMNFNGTREILPNPHRDGVQVLSKEPVAETIELEPYGLVIIRSEVQGGTGAGSGSSKPSTSRSEVQGGTGAGSVEQGVQVGHTG